MTDEELNKVPMYLDPAAPEGLAADVVGEFSISTNCLFNFLCEENLTAHYRR